LASLWLRGRVSAFLLASAAPAAPAAPAALGRGINVVGRGAENFLSEVADAA